MESIRKYLNDDDINDRQKIYGILKDILSDDLTKVNMLMMAYDIKIAKLLYEKEYSQELFNVCVDSMKTKCSYRENFAKNIVEAWLSLLGIEKICITHLKVEKRCFLRRIMDIDITGFSLKKITKIIFLTNCDISRTKGNILKFAENDESELKVYFTNDTLIFSTDAKKFVIPDSNNEKGFFRIARI